MCEEDVETGKKLVGLIEEHVASAEGAPVEALAELLALSPYDFAVDEFVEDRELLTSLKRGEHEWNGVMDAARAKVGGEALRRFAGSGSSDEKVLAALFAKHRQWDLLEKLGSEAVGDALRVAFAAQEELALAAARTLPRDDLYCGPISSLLDFARFDSCKASIRRVLLATLESRHGVALSDAAKGLRQLADPSTAGAIAAKISTVAREGKNEERQGAGHLALVLAALDAKAGAPVLEEWLKDSRWTDAAFHAQARYALWMLQGAGEAAAEWIAAPRAATGLPYAAATVADLDFKGAIAALEKALGASTNAATRAALAEAIDRLKRQPEAPGVDARMVWLFGSRHPAEIALGMESDDEFVRRATTASPHQVEAGGDMAKD